MQAKSDIELFPACPKCGNDDPDSIAIEGEELGCRKCGGVFKNEVSTN